MLIKTLVENTCGDTRLGAEHGLSLYVQSNARQILFDLGQGALFLHNARLLQIAIEQIDIVIISHGHYDHGGGLGVFLQHNQHARIFIQQHAFNRFWSQGPDGKLKDVGLDYTLAANPRFTLVNDYYKIDDELELFAGVNGRTLFSPANDSLFSGQTGAVVPDDFQHEQNLIINHPQGAVLLAGCAHNGIVNILEHVKQLKGQYPAIVIGGFHLMGGTHLQEPLDKLAGQLGRKLLQYPTRFYTNHCTGQRAFAILKDIMGPQINYLAGGDSLRI